MSFHKTHTVRTNLCSCFDANKFIIAGNPDLYTKTSKYEITLLADHSQRDFSIFDSILVVCNCGNLTIHYPTKAGGVWRSMKMWKGWRGRRTKLVWPESLSIDKRTLRNVSEIELCASDGIDRKVSFVNDPNNGLNIHEKQVKLADEIFTELLFAWVKRSFFCNINFRIRDVACLSSEIAQEQMAHLGLCGEALTAAVEELFNLKGISKSKRLKELRLALEAACRKAHISLPQLLHESDTPPKLITELLAA